MSQCFGFKHKKCFRLKVAPCVSRRKHSCRCVKVSVKTPGFVATIRKFPRFRAHPFKNYSWDVFLFIAPRPSGEVKYSPLHVTVSNVNKTLTHDLTWPESPRLVFHWQFWLFYDEGNNFRDPTLLRESALQTEASGFKWSTHLWGRIAGNAVFLELEP